MVPAGIVFYFNFMILFVYFFCFFIVPLNVPLCFLIKKCVFYEHMGNRLLNRLLQDISSISCSIILKIYII